MPCQYLMYGAAWFGFVSLPDLLLLLLIIIIRILINWKPRTLMKKFKLTNLSSIDIIIKVNVIFILYVF